MSLLQILLESINQEWENQKAKNCDEPINVLSIAYIPPELARAIEAEGNEVPNEFDPNKFNGIEGNIYATLEIRVSTGQENLLDFYYK